MCGGVIVVCEARTAMALHYLMESPSVVVLNLLEEFGKIVLDR